MRSADREPEVCGPEENDGCTRFGCEAGTGSIFTIPIPSVRMIRQPPIAVPNPIATAQVTITHVGTSTRSNRPPETSAKVIIPITFCASFEPWLKAMRLEETNCNRLNRVFPTLRVTRNVIQ